ncbi:MAG: hypothetical protein M3237_19805 [Actinomycetota bacterium]|nr:hypothetical protein [Actinomycetota bacterium]
MAKTTTLASAFAHFGTIARNPRWAWSAVSPDLKTVAVTLWEDQIAADGSVDFFGHPELERWQSQHGNRDRIRNLIIARDNCGGLFRVVVVKAHDIHEFPRQIEDRYPDDDVIMRLVNLDEQTGEFSAVRV